jgi:hypothetical protein
MVWISVKRLTVGLGLVLLVSAAAAGVGMLLWWGERGFSLPVKVKTAFSFTAIAVWVRGVSAVSPSRAIDRLLTAT